MKLLCWLGWHEWLITHNWMWHWLSSEGLAKPEVPKYQCARCNKIKE